MDVRGSVRRDARQTPSYAQDDASASCVGGKSIAYSETQGKATQPTSSGFSTTTSQSLPSFRPSLPNGEHHHLLFHLLSRPHSLEGSPRSCGPMSARHSTVDVLLDQIGLDG